MMFFFMDEKHTTKHWNRQVVNCGNSATLFPLAGYTFATHNI